MAVIGVATMVGLLACSSGSSEVTTTDTTQLDPTLQQPSTQQPSAAPLPVPSTEALDSPAPAATSLQPLPLVPIFHEVTALDPVVFRGIQADVQACMAEQGFDYVPAEAPANLQIDVLDGVTTVMDRLLPSSPERGVQAGDEESMQGPNPAWIELGSDEQREAWERAYDGTVVGQRAREGGVEIALPGGATSELPGGCVGQAQQSVLEDRAERRQLQFEFQEFYNQARERTRADPAVQQVIQEWSDCLAGRGFTYASPNDALEEAGDRDDPLGRAVGDCAAEVDWARRVNPVEVAVHEQIIAENEGLIATLADQREAARQRARELLGEE